MISFAEVSALLQVIFVDLVLAADNAIVVAMAASGLAASQRARVIIIGIIAATVLRIIFALLTTQLLKITGILLIGGLLLLWVSWKLWQEIRERRQQELIDAGQAEGDDNQTEKPVKTFRQAVGQIIVADVSMSLDNVLAVAGVAREHPSILVFGLVLSVALMGLVATFVAKLLQKHVWIAYLGLAVIVYVGVAMVVEGAMVLAATF